MEVVPKMGGLQEVNGFNNSINYMTQGLQGSYMNLRDRSNAMNTAIDAKIKGVMDWSQKPIMGGAKKKTSKKASKKVSKKSTKKTSKKSTKKSKKTKKTKKTKKMMRGGGGSDWMSTVQSRGSAAAPDKYWGIDGQKWFGQFENPADYISNSDLRMGSPQLSAQPRIAIPGGFDGNAQMHQIIDSTSGDLGTQLLSSA
jgi:hypothetical protein